MIALIGTADTKGAELKFIADVIRTMGEQVVIVDVGTRQSTSGGVDFTSQHVAAFHPQGINAVYLSDRGRSISAMSTALVRFLGHQRDLEGVVGIGGSGGTALITPAMRSLPIGMPKLMVSTMASGNVAPYVGPSDITMMYSVTDIAGLNRISRPILTNAAGAMAGMVRGYRAHKLRALDSRPAVGLSMFGVTTPCVDSVRIGLQDDFDCLVFHATGTGGQSLEKLALSGLLAGMIDITTTEIADHLVGGVLTAGPERLDAPARTGLPYVGSCGALDMVNFGHIDTVPAGFRGRKLYKHNEQVTLMRTTPEENRQFGRYIADKINAVQSPLRFFIPAGGVSMLDAPGQVFHDPEADAALFDSLTEHFENSDTRRLIWLPNHINDPAFAKSLISAFKDLAEGQA